MSHDNPHFRNVERASYELAYLLRELPRHFKTHSLTADQQQMIEAADKHAANYTSTLLHGLQSLGRVAWCAGVNEDQQVDADDLANVGLLVTEIALQLQFIGDFRGQVNELAMHNMQKDGAE